MNALLQHEAIHLFIALINNWMAVIAKKLNLPRNPSTITSRHSFSTVMKNAGASTEYIQEALGHHDIRTTEIISIVLKITLKKNTR
jgi:integrase/recombinase XerD